MSASLDNAEIEPVPEGHGRLYVMDKTGDTRVTWDRRNPEEVANAKRTFDELRGKGYLAYSVSPADGSKGQQLHAFDPDAEKIILAPQMRGG